MTTDGPISAKYHVGRNDGRDRPGGDREDAEYFVLDYIHDPYAREALEAYADACEITHPTLAADLRLHVHRARRTADQALRQRQEHDDAEVSR